MARGVSCNCWIRPLRLWHGVLGFGIICCVRGIVNLCCDRLDKDMTASYPADGGAVGYNLPRVTRDIQGPRSELYIQDTLTKASPVGPNTTQYGCATTPHGTTIRHVPYRHWNATEYRCGETLAREDSSVHIQKTIDGYNTNNYHQLPPLAFSPRYRAPCVTVMTTTPPGRRVVCFPSVHVAGFQKAGTSDLAAVLGKHPQIELGDNKEQHFWATGSGGGLMSYSKMFTKAHSNLHQWCTTQNEMESHPRLLLDESPSTLWKPYSWYSLPENSHRSVPVLTAAHAMRNLFPNNSLIAIVRDPVERLYSEYLYRHKQVSTQTFHRMAVDIVTRFRDCEREQGRTECAFSKALYQAIESRYSLQPIVGYYFHHLQTWMKIFPKEQLFIVRLEDYKSNRAETARRIFRFLNLPDPPQSVYDSMESATVVNSRVSKKAATSLGDMLPETRTLLQDFYRPLNAELACLLGDQDYTWGY